VEGQGSFPTQTGPIIPFSLGCVESVSATSRSFVLLVGGLKKKKKKKKAEAEAEQKQSKQQQKGGSFAES
jgi:hypothetical protein